MRKMRYRGEREDWVFEFDLLTEESSQFVISADWIIENDLCQILCVVIEFSVKKRGLGLFFAV